MGSPQGREAIWEWYTNEYVENGPYGGDGREVGRFALYLSQVLRSTTAETAIGPDGSPGWDKHDRKAFDYYDDFQSGIAFIETAVDFDPVPDGVPAGVSGDDLGDLYRKFHRFHAALPFSEGERYWLLAADRRFSKQDTDLVAGLLASHTTIVSAGIRQPLHGRDLVRRWAAWRRETDEFAGQGSLDEAHTVLRSIAAQLLPEQELKKPDPGA